MSKFMRVLLLNLAMLMCFSAIGCGKDDGTAPTSAPSADVQTDVPTEAPTEEPIPVEGEGAVLYQVAVKNALTMSYVIHTKNNKIIVIDGGGDSAAIPTQEINELLRVLRSATGQQVPTIDAWILTHCHSDHVNAFSHMLTNMSNMINVGKVYYNFPSDNYLYNAGMKNEPTSTLNKFKAAIATLDKDQIVIVEQGASYTVDNVTFNVLLTPDETITDAIFLSNAINESSIMFDMKLGGQRVLFLGDLGPYSSSRFRNAMKNSESEHADVVQMAHHGSQGIKKEYYWTLRPKVCLWPSPTFMWAPENQAGGGGSLALETQAVYDFLVSKGVTEHYMMKDGSI